MSKIAQHPVRRAVLYTRVSYDDRDTDGRNLQGQLDMCREYARSKGYTVVAELAEDDKGASGLLYDSRRNYFDQLNYYKAHRNGNDQ